MCSFVLCGVVLLFNVCVCLASSYGPIELVKHSDIIQLSGSWLRVDGYAPVRIRKDASNLFVGTNNSTRAVLTSSSCGSISNSTHVSMFCGGFVAVASVANQTLDIQKARVCVLCEIDVILSSRFVVAAGGYYSAIRFVANILYIASSFFRRSLYNETFIVPSVTDKIRIFEARADTLQQLLMDVNREFVASKCAGVIFDIIDDPNGYSGIANVDSVCKRSRNIFVVSMPVLFDQIFAVVFAHELGHVFGADHDTAGIMRSVVTSNLDLFSARSASAVYSAAVDPLSVCLHVNCTSSVYLGRGSSILVYSSVSGLLLVAFAVLVVSTLTVATSVVFNSIAFALLACWFIVLHYFH